MSAAARSTDPRRAELGKIHIAKQQLGLDEDTYRGLIHHVTGKRSAGELDSTERRAVLDEMARRGFRPQPRDHGRGRRERPTPAAQHRQARKARALWLSLYHLGEVRDPAEAAMDSFIARQCGISTAAWMKDPADARTVIEALKSWCERAGVVWDVCREAPNAERRAVLCAQWRRLGVPLHEAWESAAAISKATPAELDELIRANGADVRARADG